MRTGPFRLACLGLLGAAFFWATDPRLGVGAQLDGRAATNVIDAIHAAWPGTLVGLAGSAASTLIGVVLMTRRSA